MYKITSYPSKSLIELELKGFWKAETFADFRIELRWHIDRLPKKARGYLCLTDARELEVQSRELAESCAKFLTMPGVAAARIALVTGSALLKLQAQRTVATGELQIFGNTEVALAWLSGHEA